MFYASLYINRDRATEHCSLVFGRRSRRWSDEGGTSDSARAAAK